MGNRATSQLLRSDRHIAHRAVIAHGPIDGLSHDLDTADYPTSKVQILTMWNGGKLAGLRALSTALSAASPETNRLNNLWLRGLIATKLASWRSLDSDAGNSSTAERAAFDLQNPAADATGILAMPGHGEVLPAAPTATQTAALHVRSWQIGDITDMVSWSTVGAHLQGRTTPAEYQALGDQIMGYRDARNGTNLQDPTDVAGNEALARAVLLRVSTEIRAGLNHLPSRPGVSYRAATSAAGVYGTLINVGDYIKDMAFWSTAGLKLSHRGADFGSEGTANEPKVYFIIDGSTGVFLPRFTNSEVGAREILFNDQTVFFVRKITNYGDRTFFVHLIEKDPTVAPINPQTRNPWSGAINP